MKFEWRISNFNNFTPKEVCSLLDNTINLKTKRMLSREENNLCILNALTNKMILRIIN